MATQKKAAKRRPKITNFDELAEAHDFEQVKRLVLRLNDHRWNRRLLNRFDCVLLDQLLHEHGDGEAAADAFASTMAEQSEDPLSSQRLFPRSPESLADVCRRLCLTEPEMDLLHDELVAHDINPAFSDPEMVRKFGYTFAEDTDRETEVDARLRAAVEKLDTWRRREQERVLLACPKCGSTKLSRLELVEWVYPLQALWQTANGSHDWDDLEEDNHTDDEEDEDWNRSSEGYIHDSWFNGIYCDDCFKEFGVNQLDKLVPATEQPGTTTELVEQLPPDAGWVRTDKLPSEPTIEVLLDEAERYVRGWWSGEISNRGAGVQGVMSERWIYRIADGEIAGRPMPLTLGAWPTIGAYRNAAELIADGDAAILVFPGRHVDHPAQQGMVLISIRPNEARTRWIPFVLDPEVDPADMAEEVSERRETDPADILQRDYYLLTKGHEDVEPVEDTRPYVKLVQQKLKH